MCESCNCGCARVGGGVWWVRFPSAVIFFPCSCAGLVWASEHFIPASFLFSGRHLGPKVVGWARAFLCGRLQCVSINGITSAFNKVTSGIPLGIVMGPLCLLLYINDLPDVVKTSNMCLFA